MTAPPAKIIDLDPIVMFGTLRFLRLSLDSAFEDVRDLLRLRGGAHGAWWRLPGVA